MGIHVHVLRNIKLMLINIWRIEKHSAYSFFTIFLSKLISDFQGTSLLKISYITNIKKMISKSEYASILSIFTALV